MKKFISMVMAAAMVVSLVPATAFAASAQVENTVKVVNAAEFGKSDVYPTTTEDMPEVQIKVKDTDFEKTKDDEYKVEFTLTLDNAEFNALPVQDKENGAAITIKKAAEGTTAVASWEDDDEIKITITNKEVEPFADDAIISVDLDTTLTKKSVGAKATVDFASGDFATEADGMVFATIVDKGIKASIKKTVDVAEEEVTELYSKGLKIEPTVGDTFADVTAKGKEVTLKLSKGFEFANTSKNPIDFAEDGIGPVVSYDEDEITFVVGQGILDSATMTILGIDIEATTAKAGDVATLTVKFEGLDSVKVEVAKVIDYKVVMSVDEDEDVPVYYSGVDAKNTGLTVDDDHESLEVTIEESFPGAWSMHKDFTLELPEGVYVTAVDAEDENGTLEDALENDAQRSGALKLDGEKGAFWNAYQEGDHLNFEFNKRTFSETNPDNGDECHKMTFVLTLVADPGFEGDVVLKLTGDAVDTQEVTIAKFVAPYTVKAEQNDLKIDYRYTEIPTAIVITEAEAGLWAEKTWFDFQVEKDQYIVFEDDPTYVVNEESDMEIDDKDGIKFVVKEESDDEAAVVTIKDMTLFMQRNIPAGPYDLTISTEMAEAYDNQVLFAPDVHKVAANHNPDKCDKECVVSDVCDYSDTVKEAWVNIITAGREVDDASFTTKVVVPVGESYIISGENTITLDVPAYISAAGYTMLPVRAVAVALGINTNNVLWDQATKTVTILYGQRIITMVAGQKVVYVNGSAIPASAAVEIVDGRTFLPMRDLATALGVTDITWDAATKTATLNGNQK